MDFLSFTRLCYIALCNGGFCFTQLNWKLLDSFTFLPLSPVPLVKWHFWIPFDNGCISHWPLWRAKMNLCAFRLCACCSTHIHNYIKCIVISFDRVAFIFYSRHRLKIEIKWQTTNWTTITSHEYTHTQLSMSKVSKMLRQPADRINI